MLIGVRKVQRIGVNLKRGASFYSRLANKYAGTLEAIYVKVEDQAFMDAMGGDPLSLSVSEAGTFLPATFPGTVTAPDVQVLKDADGDGIWFTNGNPVGLSVSELVATDFENTFVKYDDYAPHHVRMIGLLKNGTVLTDQQKDELSEDFRLWAFYFGTFRTSGAIKENRTIGEVDTSEVPEQIDGLQHWFDPTDLSTMVLEEANGWNGQGQYVTSWEDKVGGLVASQDTLANKPFLHPDGYLLFGGAQYLLATGLSGISDALYTKIYRFYCDPLGLFVLNEINNAESSGGRMYAYLLTTYVNHYSGSGTLRRHSGNVTAANWHTHGVLYHDTEASQKLFRNGVDNTTVKTSGGIVAQSNYDRLYLGSGRNGGQNMTGRLQDFLLYNSELTEQDHNDIHTFFEER